jgi:hypothetical protein
MPRYTVRPGAVLPHMGALLYEGEYVELPRHVADDSIVRDLVQEVDETGAPVLTPAPIDADLARFRPHERITLLQNRMVDARALVSRLADAIAIEERTIEEASLSAAPAPTPAARAFAPTDEE